MFAWPFRSPGAEFYTAAKDTASQVRHNDAGHIPSDHPFADSHAIRSVLAAGGHQLLDIGCGNGTFANFASGFGFQVTGVDFDKASIAVARSRNLPGCNFVEGDVIEYLIRDGEKYDVITCFDSIEHVEKVRLLVHSIRERLKPNGMFCGFLPIVDRLMFWSLNEEYERPPYHLTFWTEDVWRKFVMLEGFKIIHVGPYGYNYLVSRLRSKVKKTGIRSSPSSQAREQSHLGKASNPVSIIIAKTGLLVEHIYGRGTIIYFEVSRV